MAGLSTGSFALARILVTRNRAALAIGAALAAILLHGAVPTGPNIGARVPDFQLQDQNGNQKTLGSIMGPKGALLVFYRSADW
ncbi:MAG: hypothetical protein ACLQU1_37110 [Bryobacteraceae bacterium]